MTEEPLNIIHLISNRTWGRRRALCPSTYADACAADGHSIAVVTRGIEAVDSRFAAAGFKPDTYRWADLSTLSAPCSWQGF